MVVVAAEEVAVDEEPPLLGRTVAKWFVVVVEEEEDVNSILSSTSMLEPTGSWEEDKAVAVSSWYKRRIQRNKFKNSPNKYE